MCYWDIFKPILSKCLKYFENFTFTGKLSGMLLINVEFPFIYLFKDLHMNLQFMRIKGNLFLAKQTHTYTNIPVFIQILKNPSHTDEEPSSIVKMSRNYLVTILGMFINI